MGIIWETPKGEGVDEDVALRLQAYVAGFSDLSAVPILRARPMAGLTPREAFVLSMVDGTMSLGEILQATPMRHIDTLRVLCTFAEKGFIGERPPGEHRPADPGRLRASLRR